MLERSGRDAFDLALEWLPVSVPRFDQYVRTARHFAPGDREWTGILQSSGTALRSGT